MHALVLAPVVVAVWVIPAVRGPVVECIDIDAAACEQEWRSVAAGLDGIQRVLPVTAARVRGSANVTCPQVYVEWLWGAWGVSVVC